MATCFYIIKIQIIPQLIDYSCKKCLNLTKEYYKETISTPYDSQHQITSLFRNSNSKQPRPLLPVGFQQWASQTHRLEKFTYDTVNLQPWNLIHTRLNRNPLVAYQMAALEACPYPRPWVEEGHHSPLPSQDLPYPALAVLAKQEAATGHTYSAPNKMQILVIINTQESRHDSTSKCARWHRVIGSEYVIRLFQTKCINLS